MNESTSKKRGAYFATYGCQMNEYDSRKMLESLSREYQPVDDPSQADFILINTCSVREKPMRKVFSEIGKFASLKKTNRELIIAVAGCVAQQMKEELLEKAPQLDLVVGTDAQTRLPELIAQVRAHGRFADTTVDREQFHRVNVEWPLIDYGPSPYTAFVAIQKGCDKFCSYCILPYTRGRERNRPLAEIVEEVNVLVQRGIREVTLLGQNVNAYGTRSEDQHSFATLLSTLSEIDDLWRIRFVTSHPSHIDDEQIAAIAELPKVCEYLHLPIQSGSDNILKRMNRGYTRNDYLHSVQRIRKSVTDLALSGDMIVGFPGETEEDFRQTLDVLEKIRYETLFSFIYSPRPGTKASMLADDTPREVHLERLNRLQELQKKISLDVSKRYKDTVQEVIVEKTSKQNESELSGRTRTNRIVNFPGPHDLIGTRTTVVITDVFQNSLRGKIIEPDAD